MADLCCTIPLTFCPPTESQSGAQCTKRFPNAPPLPPLHTVSQSTATVQRFSPGADTLLCITKPHHRRIFHPYNSANTKCTTCARSWVHMCVAVKLFGAKNAQKDKNISKKIRKPQTTQRGGPGGTCGGASGGRRPGTSRGRSAWRPAGSPPWRRRGRGPPVSPCPPRSRFGARERPQGTKHRGHRVQGTGRAQARSHSAPHWPRPPTAMETGGLTF